MTEFVKLVWATCASVLLILAVIVFTQGRPAGELHAQAVRDLAMPRAADDGRAPGAGRSTPSPGATSPPSRTTGPGVDSPGVAISARVSTPTSLDVSESVRVSAPRTSITIAPPKVSGASSDLASLTPVLRSVQVTSGGQVVPIVDSPITAPLRIQLPEPADSFEVRYLLDSSIARTLPSKAGRALAGLGPVIAGAGDSPVTYAFAGDEIIGVSCPDLGATAFACGSGQPGRLAVTTPLQRSASLVLLQLNLPRP